MNCVFFRGELDNVRSFDINSSYPYAMIEAPMPVGPYYMKTLNDDYTGEPLEAGIYRLVVIKTPVGLREPFICVKKMGLLVFP